MRPSPATSAPRSSGSSARTGSSPGYDMRDSSPGLAAAFAAGATSQGADVLDIGLASTDLLYFASGSLDVPGRDVHREPQPGPLQRHQAVPGGRGAGRPGQRPRGHPGAGRAGGSGPRRARSARSSSASCCADYSTYLKGLVPGIRDIRALKVVVDAGNGMGGLTVPEVFADLPLDVTPLFFELDGSFPNHEANPIDPANLRRPAGRGARVARGHRPGLRRRRRPLLRRRRARRDRVAVRAHRADRGPGDRPRAGRDRHPQPDHLARGARDRARARRRAVAYPGRPLVHQGVDGRDRRGLRRRALGALLLPRLLAGRLRDARRAACPRRARDPGRDRCRRCSRSSAGTQAPARSTARSPTRSPRRRRCGRRSPAATAS